MHTNRTSSLSGADMERKMSAFYLRQLRRIWKYMPNSVHASSAGSIYARYLDKVVRRNSDRNQSFTTFFLRNRPELELLQTLIADKPIGAELRMTVLACSKGAEVYSMAWAIRSARPDLRISLQAIDISPAIIEFAIRGAYSLRKPQPTDVSSDSYVSQNGAADAIPSSDPNHWLFKYVSDEEMEAMFGLRGDQAIVKPWLREGIQWFCGDANDPNLVERLGGRQEIVVANRFLCHMRPPEAIDCLRNIGCIVDPGGYLFVSGVDLDVRTAVAREQGWIPVTQRMREIHNGDESLHAGWPTQWWGLEPFDETRSDWQVRYASVFQVGMPLGRPSTIGGADRVSELVSAGKEIRQR
jgi:chemotaxis methyl-accepting protein methylase